VMVPPDSALSVWTARASASTVTLVSTRVVPGDAFEFRHVVCAWPMAWIRMISLLEDVNEMVPPNGMRMQ